MNGKRQIPIFEIEKSEVMEVKNVFHRRKRLYYANDKEMVRVLFSLMFGKKYVSVELEKENKYEVSGKNLKDFLDMIDSGQINEAENILLDNIDYTNNDDVMAAALFYQYLSEKDSEFLINNNYTKEEVLSGFKQLLVQSEYNNLLYMIKDDE